MNVKVLLLIAFFSYCKSQTVEQSVKVSDESYEVECISNEAEIGERAIMPHNSDIILIDVEMLPILPRKS